MTVQPVSIGVTASVCLKKPRYRLGFPKCNPASSLAIPDTSVSLLVQLKDSENHSAWESFVKRYGPLIYGFGLRRGISQDEADDFAQDVLSQVSRSMEKFDYDPTVGTFRSWLFQVARNVLFNRQRTIGRRPGLTGGSTLMRAAEQNHASGEESRLREEWDLEYRRQLFARAAEEVKAEVAPELWEAFWRTAVLEEKGETVAADLGIATGTLYVRRSRILAKVREAAARIEAEWEKQEALS